MKKITSNGIALASLVSSFLIVALFGIFCISIFWEAIPAIVHNQFDFFTKDVWNPSETIFGAKPFIYGTLVTALLAMLFSLPFSLAIAILMGEFHSHGKIISWFTLIFELLAGIPSVIYGFWALFYLVPIMQHIQIYYELVPYGVGLFTAAVILAIMIIPYSATFAREAIQMVPQARKEAAYALGASRFEVIRDVVLPHSLSGITAGVLLSLGRALGETIAVTMVIGNANRIPESIFAPGNTIASLLVNEFSGADNSLYVSSLMELTLVLLSITIVINVIGRTIVSLIRKKYEA
jgi:phosphate transport system permease protein